MRSIRILRLLAVMVAGLALCGKSVGADALYQVKVDWSKVTRISKSTASLQVVVNPPLRRGSRIHDQVFQELKNLGADCVRYVPWLPYPKLGVAELEPPRNGKTSWDFSLIDPTTIDFMNAMSGHSVVMNFCTIPQWMFVTPKPVPYPADPDQVTWDYEQGTQLRDPSLKEVADYYKRLVSWYTKGGFTDEYGKRHESGHHFKIDYWEVLNEANLSQHNMSAEEYTAIYDAIVSAIREVDSTIKFVGMAWGGGGTDPQPFEYFLDPSHHKPGIPIDMISYHTYAQPTPDQTPEVQQFTFFEQADQFLTAVRYIQATRDRLSPETGTNLNELGCISADDLEFRNPNYIMKPIPASYWNLCSAVFAYWYGRLTDLGVEVVGASQLVGYPTQFPSVSMVDWDTGQPNARYWTLKLLKDNFGPGDKVVAADSGTPYVYVMAVVTPDGHKRLLLVNKRDRLIKLKIPGINGGNEEFVDQETGMQPPGSVKVESDILTLKGYAVVVLTLQ